METEFFPKKFLERINRIIPSEQHAKVLESFAQPKKKSIRANTLKFSSAELTSSLNALRIKYSLIPWAPEAVTVEDQNEELSSLDFINDGRAYIQNLSSMLVSKILSPESQENILDLCAAPGSKTSHLAALMQNTGQIVAVEASRERMYKLKAVCGLLGVQNASFMVEDGRVFKPPFQFDRILVDAPCSSEGRFHADDLDSAGQWNIKKVKDLAQKQKGLINNALRYLKPGGVMVYSTCTLSPEENEEVVDWLISKAEGKVKILPVSIAGIPHYPALLQWEKKRFDPQVENCLRVLPTDRFDGFFIVKIMKI